MIRLLNNQGRVRKIAPFSTKRSYLHFASWPERTYNTQRLKSELEMEIFLALALFSTENLHLVLGSYE